MLPCCCREQDRSPGAGQLADDRVRQSKIHLSALFSNGDVYDRWREFINYTVGGTPCHRSRSRPRCRCPTAGMSTSSTTGTSRSGVAPAQYGNFDSNLLTCSVSALPTIRLLILTCAVWHDRLTCPHLLLANWSVRFDAIRNPRLLTWALIPVFQAPAGTITNIDAMTRLSKPEYSGPGVQQLQTFLFNRSKRTGYSTVPPRMRRVAHAPYGVLCACGGGWW